MQIVLTVAELLGIATFVAAWIIGGVIWCLRLEGRVNGMAEARKTAIEAYNEFRAKAAHDIEKLKETAIDIATLAQSIERMGEKFAGGMTTMAMQIEHLTDKMSTAKTHTDRELADIKHLSKSLQSKVNIIERDIPRKD